MRGTAQVNCRSRSQKCAGQRSLLDLDLHDLAIGMACFGCVFGRIKDGLLGRTPGTSVCAIVSGSGFLHWISCGDLVRQSLQPFPPDDEPEFLTFDPGPDLKPSAGM